MKPPGAAPETVVAGNDGAVNAGEGTQYNDSSVHHGTGDQNISTIFVGAEYARFAMDERGRLRHLRTVVTSRRLEDLRARYVVPPGYDEEERRRELAAHGILVMSGPEGVGRRTTAQLTLVPKGWEREVDLREIQVEADPRPVLDAGDVQRGERILVDLTGPVSDVAELRRDIVVLASQVREAEARLVLVVDEDDVRQLPDDLRERSVALRRPDGAAVLDSHLRQYRTMPAVTESPGDGVSGAGSSVPLSEAVTAWLGHASMSEIEELARRTRDEHRTASGPGGVRELLDRVLGHGHPDADQALDEASGRDRALLLAAAFFEGARLDHHSAAVERLLPTVRAPEDETPPLERKRFVTQLERVGAGLGEDRRIGFTSPGYGRALRTAFWDACPHLQAEFASWIDACVADPELPPADRDAVAERWAEQALRTHRLSELLGRVDSWAAGLGPQAALLLSSALADARHGTATRQQVYVWARNRTIPRALAYVLVAVCAKELATTHPDQALVRLHHLADNADRKAAEAARSTLSRLADDPALYRRLLRRVSNKLAGPDRRNREIDRVLFWDLTAPAMIVGGRRPHTARRDVTAWMATGLPVALSLGPHTAAHYAERLLSHPGSLPDLLVDQLVTAAMDTGCLSSLYTTALRWSGGGGTASGTPTPRPARVDRLLRRIDAAQGLDLSSPTDPSRKDPTP
ncbi:hypothetical protein [Nocardiopsis sp. CNS-639]|uniref:hypothetical protein n=1 Tax=Nocardiopsis sp. CNS-639 TaxID=1169153 RepID=UPI0004761B6A|nr:hypothetical protein [Nocardiopsis sp. CNS-639]